MGRTNIDIDDELIERVMSTSGLGTRREAVHFVHKCLPDAERMTIEEQLEMEGVGCDGDLDTMRAH